MLRQAMTAFARGIAIPVYARRYRRFERLFPEARRGWSRAVWLTGVAYALTCALFVFANRLTTAGNAIFIQSTAPVWVMLLSPRLPSVTV